VKYWKTCIVQAVKPQGSPGIEIASATCSRLDKPLDGWDFRPDVYRWRQVNARKVHNSFSHLHCDHYNAVVRKLRDEKGLYTVFVENNGRQKVGGSDCRQLEAV
jgi:hypothetical protein